METFRRPVSFFLYPHISQIHVKIEKKEILTYKEKRRRVNEMQMKYEKVLQCEEENINGFFHRSALVTSCGLNVLGSSEL